MIPRRRGFTLIEVVLAIAIGALLLMAVYAVLAAAQGAQQTVDRQTRAGRTATALFAQLRLDIAAATLYRDDEVAFIGDVPQPGGPHRLDLLTLAPARSEIVAPQGGALAITPNEVGYQARREGAAAYYRLYRREQTWRDATPTAGGALEALADGVQTFKLSFRDDGGWVDQWIDRKRLPRAVRVELVIWAGDGPTPAAREPGAEYRFVRRIAIPGRGVVLDLGKPSPDAETEEEGGGEPGDGG